MRVRLGAGLSRLSGAAHLAVELDEGATVDDLYARIGDDRPDLAPALRSALPVVRGEHAPRTRALRHGDEVALLLPMSGG